MRRATLLLTVLVARLAVAEEPLFSERRGPAPGGPDFVYLARTVAPAVVNVSVRGPEAAGRTREGIGVPAPLNVGSGFVIRKDGLMLTGYHVVEGGGSIRVRTAGGDEFDATMVGGDERTDLALLRIRAPRPLPVVPLGDSDAVQIGEWVMAIGNPLGLEHTVTVGIVSAKGRRELPVQRNLYQNFIQTDASINPGSSGGPLINAGGEVVGIATAVNREAQGIGFATPINMAKALLPQLYARGRVQRSWIGIHVQPGDLTPMLTRAFRLPAAEGALVTEVLAGSPAERAGLRPGDVVVDLDGKRVGRDGELAWLASLVGVGRRIPLRVFRDGKPRRVEVEVSGMPDEEATIARAPEAPAARQPRAAIGVSVAEVNEDMARAMRLDGRLVVTGVERGGPADGAGVETGDVVLQVNDQGVRSVDEYFAALRGVSTGETIRLLLRRGGRPLWVAFAKG